MASIYKRTQDAKKKRASWYIGYSDHRGRWKTRKGFTDRGETERLAAKLEHEAMLRRRGLIDPDAERAAEHRNAAIEEPLAVFKESISDNSPKHVKLIIGRVRRVIDACKFTCIGDITREAVQSAISDFVAENKLGPRTYNHYVQAFDEFCKWLVSSKRLLTNPVLGLERRNTEVDIRRKRRALTAEESTKLIASARSSKKRIQRYDGETRARIYTISYMTGLRRNEIASLTPRSFDLISEQPTVTVEAAFSKHRRKDVLPLHPELVALLAKWLAGIGPDEVLFPMLAKRRTWKMVKHDLEQVGIAYETPEGVADFHAAGRHTHITQLLSNGVTLPQAKELARHTDVKMTMRYTHIGLKDQAAAVSRLPWRVERETEGESDTSNERQEKSRECIGSDSGVSDGHFESLSGNHIKPSREDKHDPSRAADARCRNESRDVLSGKKADRSFDSRRLHSLNQDTDNDLGKIEKSLGVSGECSTDADCLSEAVSVSSFAPTIAYIAERWQHLPPHIREAILTLVDTVSSRAALGCDPATTH